ncbi:MAG: DNA mismatch repair protein MutS [Chloroflexi bacterium]|nr:DNA mismatch repair protein MutS [Chloroflexota bacterium]PKB57133.1 MAG: DNA mismatch repair protein MutS [SAR202 cluster bacterium Casp-Chloro-G3]
MTPVRRQYLKIKHSYPDAIVLFRLGDFYETFDDDAQLAARELEITLTSRSMGKDLKVPMAGVPAHALESYLARLIKKGHKVAICEQLSDPAASKGLVERDVVRVVTPGTVVESGLLEQKTNNYLAAVIEDGDTAGLAYVDITTGEFATTQLPTDRLSLELERVSPAEVLVPDASMTDNQGLALSSVDQTVGEGRHVTPVIAASFDLNVCRDALLEQYQILSLESFGCEALPLAVRAAGAVIDYLGRTYKTAKPQLGPLSTYSTAAYMTLDAPTRRNLELFQAGRGGSSQLSLLATLDQTKTPMGARLLRRWLAQPLLDLAQLSRRLDAVGFFHQDAFQRRTALDTLAKIVDLERVCGRVQAGTAAPRELLALKSGIEASAVLAEQCKGCEGGSLSWLGQELVPIPEVVALIGDSIAPEPSGSVGEGGVLRPGFSAELDHLKSASSDARGFIAGLEQRERERTGIKNLKVGYNHVFGYYIEVSNANLAQVPEDYIRRQTLTNGQRYMVPELKEYESLVLSARERIEEMERDLYRRVCVQIAESAGAISRLAQGVAQVDVFAGLAEVAVRNRYVRPQINQGNVVSIKDGRHPVVEQVLDTGSYVPNDVYLSNDDAQIIVLTGPNMAGKSTYIRQVAIITLMAQIGSFVPAAEAVIGLVDRIFTRVGLQDDLTTGQSTFMVEMVETAAILNQATPRSLLILDEIGRGTSTYDGLSIARAVIEHLHNESRLRCKALFATHYHELTELANTLPGVRNYNVAVVEEGNDVVFLHRILPGGADRSYGVHVARLAGLPPAVIHRAWEVLSDLEQPLLDQKSSRKRGSRSGPPVLQMPLFSPSQPLVEEVLGVDIANLTPLEAINKLYELQEQAKGLKETT